MASVDGSRSVQGASDEAFSYECDPCKSDDKVKEGKHFCQTCQEYLCDECRNYHKKFKEMRDHIILSGSLSNIRGTTDQAIPGVKCGCNKNLVELYCENHNEVICSFCKTVKHNSCQIRSIQDHCARSRGLEQKHVLQKTKTLQARTERVQGEKQKNNKTFEKMGDDCVTKIKHFRSKICTLLDGMEQKWLKEIDQLKNRQNHSSAQQTLILTNLLHMLQMDCDRLEDAKRSDKKEVMFAAGLKISKNLEGYETALTKVENEATFSSLTFEENTILESVITENGLGKLKINGVEQEASRQVDHHTILDLKVISSNKVNVNLPDDKGTRNVGGVAFMPNGKLILVDSFSKRVKLLDNTFAVEDSLFLTAFTDLWDITAIDNTTAIVTIPGDNKLQFIHTTPVLREGRAINIDGHCYSVAMLNDELYVCCGNHTDDKGDILVLDIVGRRNREIGQIVGRFSTFVSPRRITVSPQSRKLYVSDYATDTVTCLTPDGTILYQYQDKNIRRVHGLYVDSEDNVLVCSITGTIEVLTSSGVKNKTLLSRADGLRNSQAIDFRPKDSTLVVGCWNEETVLTFKLAWRLSTNRSSWEQWSYVILKRYTFC